MLLKFRVFCDIDIRGVAVAITAVAVAITAAVVVFFLLQ